MVGIGSGVSGGRGNIYPQRRALGWIPGAAWVYNNARYVYIIREGSYPFLLTFALLGGV